MRAGTLFLKLTLIAYGVTLNIGGLSKSPRALALAAIPPFLYSILFIKYLIKRFLPDIRLPANRSHGRSVLLTLLISIIFFVQWLNQAPPVRPPRLWYSLSGARPCHDHRIRARAEVTAKIGRDLYQSRIIVLGVERRKKLHRRGQGRRRQRNPRSRRYRPKRRRNYRRNRDRSERDSRWQPIKSISSGRPVGTGNPFTAVIRMKNDNLRPGCIVDLQLSGRGVPRPLNQTSFDRYLARRGAVSYLWISPRYHVRKKECPPPAFRLRFRNIVRVILEKRARVPERARAVIGAMLFGSSRLLNPEDKKNAARLGILHLFAASGLHLGIFYGCLYFPFAFILGRRNRLAILIPLPLCAAYLWLLEFPVSLTRAFLFLSFFALANLVNRKLTAANLLVNTALLLLFIKPAEFCSLSGVLSLGAVGGILFFYRLFREGVFPGYGGLRGIFFSQLSLNVSASLLTAPVLLYVFKAHSFGALVANQLLVPLTGLLLPPVYLGLLLEFAVSGGILPADPAGLFIWPLVDRGFRLFLYVSDTLAPHAFYLRFDGILNLVSVSVLIVIIALSFRNRRVDSGAVDLTRLSGIRRWIILTGILLLGPPGAAVIRIHELLLSLLQSGPY